MSTLNTTTIDTRPTTLNNTTDVGKSYFETDSNKILVWDGAGWNEWNSDLTIGPGFQNNFTAALDGTNQYLTVPSSTAFDFGTGEFSITFWMRITSRDQYGGLVYSSNSNRLKFQNANHIINLMMSGSDKTVITYNPEGTNTSLLGSWHHIAVIRSGTTLRGYVDNVQYGSVTATQSFSLNSQKWGVNAGHYIGGQLDEISIFDRALTSAERTEIYNNGDSFDIGSSYTGVDAPLAFYRCGDDANDTNDTGSSSISDGDTIGTIKNVVNPGTHDMSDGGNGATYSTANNPV